MAAEEVSWSDFTRLIATCASARCSSTSSQMVTRSNSASCIFQIVEAQPNLTGKYETFCTSGLRSVTGKAGRRVKLVAWSALG